MDAYATINNMREISQSTGYLLSNVYMGIGEIAGMGYCVDNMQTMQTVELQLMTSQGSRNCSYMGNRSRCTQQVKYDGNTDVFCFGFNFVSPKWTRTKFVIVISPSLQAF